MAISHFPSYVAEKKCPFSSLGRILREGWLVGDELGKEGLIEIVGEGEGRMVGDKVGGGDGRAEGGEVGTGDGKDEGEKVVRWVGEDDGSSDGSRVRGISHDNFPHTSSLSSPSSIGISSLKGSGTPVFG